MHSPHKFLLYLYIVPILTRISLLSRFPSNAQYVEVVWTVTRVLNEIVLILGQECQTTS